MTKRDANRLPRGAQGATMTEAAYRELIRTYIDRALADQSIAERLAEEARQRFGAEIDVAPETD
jgi:hypothetical protein